MSSPIFTLPPELLQHIIVVVATPSTIAALTQTCKFFYSLVYNPTDHHLWRQIFLTVFDDPRPVLAHLTTLRGEQPPFVWEEEFKSRMRAAQVVYRSNHPPTSCSSDVDMQSTLRTLLSILETSLPFTWTTTVAFGPLPTPTPSIPPKYPAFPPLILLLSSSFCNASNKAQFSGVFESSSSLWLEELLRDGFPRVLTRRLLASPDLLGGDDIASGSGGDSSEVSVEQEWKEWTESEEARLFYKLVVHTGFIPVPTQDAAAEAPLQTNALDDPASGDGTTNTYFTPTSSVDDLLPQTPSEIPPPPRGEGDPSTDAQFASARRMARRTVYDLRFLKPERMFGPFLPSSSSLPVDGTQKKKTRVDGDGDDGDYVYPDMDSDGDNTESLNSSDEEEEEEDISLINLISPPNPIPPSPSPSSLPSPSHTHTLKPDWSWLAAARITVEANLRDMLKLTSAIDGSNPASSSTTASSTVGGDTSLDVGNALRRLEGVRMGGAPGFWDGWGVGGGGGGRTDGEVEVDGKGKGKSKAVEEEEGMYEERSDGWDWAGVAGIWKRCICWLDYRDLLINNLQFGMNRFNDDTLQEALRIFPMTLRVSGYSWPTAPAFDFASTTTTTTTTTTSSSTGSSSRSSGTCSAAGGGERLLPIIHVEGEMTGLDHEVTRYLQGTISMIRDGVVRWSLISSHSDESPWEWSTEGVQIGGVGSALGVLGLWTGADHERTDPLGPFWMWKVA